MAKSKYTKAIVNLYTNVDRYISGGNRLKESFYNSNSNSDVQFLQYSSEDEVGAPKHHENNYAFKVYAIKKTDADLILWLDSSVVLVKDVKPIFDLIKKQGVFFESSGHMVGSWCNDETLLKFGITRDEAFNMPMFSSGMTGINFKSKIGQEFFSRWHQSMLRGDFNGDWANHRHNQTSGSIIANLMGLTKFYTKDNHYFPYIRQEHNYCTENAIGHLVGC